MFNNLQRKHISIIFNINDLVGTLPTTTNEDICDWYMKGSNNTADDIAPINSFKAAMIETN